MLCTVCELVSFRHKIAVSVVITVTVFWKCEFCIRCRVHYQERENRRGKPSPAYLYFVMQLILIHYQMLTVDYRSPTSTALRQYSHP